MTKDVISLSISVLLLFRHYISHKITFGAPSSGGVLCSACSAFILFSYRLMNGGHASGFKHVRPETYKPRLFHVRRGENDTVELKEVHV